MRFAKERTEASLEMCGRARTEGGAGVGQGSGGHSLQREWFVLPAGFACHDPGEEPFETVRDVARSHTKHASPNLGHWQGARRQAGNLALEVGCVYSLS